MYLLCIRLQQIVLWLPYILLLVLQVTNLKGLSTFEQLLFLMSHCQNLCPCSMQSHRHSYKLQLHHLIHPIYLGVRGQADFLRNEELNDNLQKGLHYSFMFLHVLMHANDNNRFHVNNKSLQRSSVPLKDFLEGFLSCLEAVIWGFHSPPPHHQVNLL